MRKFNRKFRVLIQTNDTTNEAEMEFLEIKDPFTVDVSIDRNIMSSLNTMTLKIYNLKESTYAQIFKDRFSSQYKRVIFQAGYGRLTQCYQGNIFSAFTQRSGADIITIIESKDGGYDNQTAQVSTTFNAGVTREDIVKAAIDSFGVVKEGITSFFNDSPKRRPTTYDGSSFGLINKEVSGAFIDNEKLNILNDNEYINEPIFLINSDTGLLGTPKRQDSYLTAEMLFEPNIVNGQLVELQSNIQKQFNGQFKVIGVQHSGTFSSAIGGSVKTTLSLLLPDQITGELKAVG